MSLTQANPLVDVIWWTDSDLYLKCPYCEELHHHGFRSYESALRVPHCGFPRPSYRYRFPVTYEIDKARARFININALEALASDAQHNSEYESFLSDQLSNMNNNREISFEDSKEIITIPLEGEEPFEQRRIPFAISSCVCGETSRVRHYLTESVDKSIFLHGRDYHGDTCLIMASREETLSMISLLLDFGARVNATNKNGRSALMEACLWGRLENVKILLSRGADRSLRDNRKQRALDLTKPTHKNRKERHTVGGGIWGDPSREPIYKEDVVNRDIDRREIARLLDEGDLHTKADLVPQYPDTASHSFRRSPTGQSVTLYGPIRQYPISTSYKTIALLERGIAFPSIAAMSGWGHSQWPSTRVSGKDWTDRVLKLATIVGHTLAVDARKDHGIQGQFFASHAEKQLIAYFLDRHVFLEEDKKLDSRFDKEIADEKLKISELASIYPNIPRIYQLQYDRKQLEFELFDKDDRLLGGEYNEALVQRLKREVSIVDDEIALLGTRPEIRKLKAREGQIRRWEDKKTLQRRLNRISTMEPEATLRGASILITSPSRKICEDCLLFKDRVNCFFGLLIELRECTT
ncbi:uncharacterized protein N7518_006131 [Penicillium psychrosexuale]|uniref:uncharacterized protein n=1 Tax=Penicillium psychrosexuale TaxID=1002107 RepID=UPI0025452222|nr:uncharacterized protein N7518_006131 [Penicillium psychrosexuale]KAJ5789120.1 hypothetical protein N7518_006131 [Penicillium psychrosexuale]